MFSALISSNFTIKFAPPIGCVFWNARSSCFLNGVRTRSSVRGALPNVNGAASDHAAGFSQRRQPHVASYSGLSKNGSTPDTTFGRCPLPKRFELLLLCDTEIG